MRGFTGPEREIWDRAEAPTPERTRLIRSPRRGFSSRREKRHRLAGGGRFVAGVKGVLKEKLQFLRATGE